MAAFDGLAPYVAVFASAALSDAWRVAGVLLARRIDDQAPLFLWVRMVANAIVAALVAQLVFTPAGVLGEAPLWLRLAGFATGFAAYWLSRRSYIAGVLAGEAAVALGAALVRAT